MSEQRLLPFLPGFAPVFLHPVLLHSTPNSALKSSRKNGPCPAQWRHRNFWKVVSVALLPHPQMQAPVPGSPTPGATVPSQQPKQGDAVPWLPKVSRLMRAIGCTGSLASAALTGPPGFGQGSKYDLRHSISDFSP